MEKRNFQEGAGDEPGDRIYGADGYKDKYIFYRGDPAFSAKFTGQNRCRAEGWEERFPFGSPDCRQLIEMAGRKGYERFKTMQQCL